jgi:hypothetical protein
MGRIFPLRLRDPMSFGEVARSISSSGVVTGGKSTTKPKILEKEKETEKENNLRGQAEGTSSSRDLRMGDDSRPVTHVIQRGRACPKASPPP